MKVGSLFSGIGGLDLGLERAGMDVVWQSEIDPFACRVLAKHWPTIPNLGNITTIDWSTVERPDLICGGFPCQDISSVTGRVGGGRGLQGEHSGLWTHMLRAVARLRPRFLLVENSPNLLTRGGWEVAADLASIGYDTEWEVVPAAAVGAPHLRARLWILAYPTGFGDGLAEETVFAGRNSPVHSDWWLREPGVGRVVDGPAFGLDRRVRLKALGNAVVPQVTEWIGRAIMGVAPKVDTGDAGV